MTNAETHRTAATLDALEQQLDAPMASPVLAKARRGHGVGNAALALVAVLKWPVFGALFAAGAIAVMAKYGKAPMRELGKQAGEGAADGVASKIPLAGLASRLFSSGDVDRYGRWRR